MSDGYQSPLVERYSSREMLDLWAPATRHGLWRQLWTALASAQRDLGLKITAEQITALERAAGQPIDYAAVAARERETRHDVMAHLHVFGEAAPEAAGIMHLGATSCFVTDNAELVLMRHGLHLVARRLREVMRRLAVFARQHCDLPTLGFTHLQPAQPTTVGKRASTWLQDFLLAHQEVIARAAGLRMRGAKGTTGTQDSYLKLFENPDLVRQLDQRIAQAFDFEKTYAVTGQTYPRLVDSQVLAALSTTAQAAARMANDVRFLAHLREVEEPFESTQIGSSAMAYKRNPMRSERINSLSRHLLSLVSSSPATASAQFLERTLDDSAARRMAIPESFLAADAITSLAANVAGGLVVNPAVISRRLEGELPFMVTEAILMSATSAGGDRQQLHENIRIHSHAAAARMKEGDGVNDLLSRIAGDPAFAAVVTQIPILADASQLTGRAADQVTEFLDTEVDPVLAAHDDASSADEEETIRV